MDTFVLSDNRDNSQDSRVVTRVGFIPLANLAGRADARFFSIRGSDRNHGP
jgi:signal peptidase I